MIGRARGLAGRVGRGSPRWWSADAEAGVPPWNDPDDRRHLHLRGPVPMLSCSIKKVILTEESAAKPGRFPDL
jgi:hypothetical protein